MKKAGPAKPMLKNHMKNQKGFTLVEIIAVLVILGILAAVAVPKYFDLQQQAKDRAAQGALAEGVARINQHFASRLLAGSAFDTISYEATRVGTNMGDFILSIPEGEPASATAPIVISVTGRAGTAVDPSYATRDVPRPGAP